MVEYSQKDEKREVPVIFYETIPDGDEPKRTPPENRITDKIDYDKLADKIALRLFTMLVANKPK